QFKPILRQIKGDQLYSAKTRRLFKIELKSHNYSVIIYAKDLDGLETETQKKDNVFKWFKELDALTNTAGILLLNIYELEALILADIDTFNEIFDTAINFTGNPMYKEKPKEYLKEQTRKNRRKFGVSENPFVFKSLRIERVIKNCPYFKEFIIDFEKRVPQ
ncbi:MAG: DUF4276 family protein, partial [bacterium]|nr:DUF4276 family protein [bacterium]